MIETLLLIPDQHAHPDFNNNRADWLSKLIIDLKPDCVINMGDAADMSSLSSYDKGTRSFVGRSYKADIDAHNEFQERVWEPVRRLKKRLPRRIVLEGNHEHRVERALDLSPELTGTIGFGDYNFDRYYDEIVRYEGGTPGIIEVEGIILSHYFITGVSGRPVSGERPAHMLLAKNGISSIQAHTHIFDFATRKTVSGETMNGLVCGCYQDYINPWAGNIGKLWKAGVVILRNVEKGNFDIQWISIENMKKMYAD